MSRSFVPFEALWEMAIDVPYSFMVRDNELAWSCGQLALDKSSQVIGANNISKQSHVVCDYIEEIIDRGGIDSKAVTKLLLYYVNTGETDRQSMLEIFGNRFGKRTLLIPIGVPYFYYDGVLLEVDVYCDSSKKEHHTYGKNGVLLDAVSTASHTWVSLEANCNSPDYGLSELASFLSELSVVPEAILSEHWFSPRGKIGNLAKSLASKFPNFDSGAVIDLGPKAEKIRGHFMFSRNGTGTSNKITDKSRSICLVVRQDKDITWLQARSLGDSTDVVTQTTAIMQSIAATFPAMNLNFRNVVKSTTHYVGGSTAAELHDNMHVRNAYYEKPGPASTGLPVFGFSDSVSQIVVDLTLRR